MPPSAMDTIAIARFASAGIPSKIIGVLNKDVYYVFQNNIWGPKAEMNNSLWRAILCYVLCQLCKHFVITYTWQSSQ